MRMDHRRGTTTLLAIAALFVSSAIISNVWMYRNYLPWNLLGDMQVRNAPCVEDGEQPTKGQMTVWPVEEEEPEVPTTPSCVSIVYRVGTIRTDCDLKRFLALAKSVPPENYTVVLLHDPDLPLEGRISTFLQENFGHIEVSQISQDMLRLRMYKDPFFMWASNRSSCHYWVVEDDLVFTGEWGHFFSTVDQRVGNKVDYVSQSFIQKIERWGEGMDCNVMGQSCLIGNTTEIAQASNNLFRISQQLVDHVADLMSRNQLQGNDEAYLPAVCQKYPGCQHQQLFPKGPYWERQFFGYSTLGGWSVWTPQNKNKSVYTLAGLARLRATKTINFDEDRIWKALNSTDLLSQRPPPNRLFHPVKCSADPMIGDVSLGYVAAASLPGYSNILNLLTQ